MKTCGFVIAYADKSKWLTRCNGFGDHQPPAVYLTLAEAERKLETVRQALRKMGGKKSPVIEVRPVTIG